MAIRIRSSFHAGGRPRSMAELASVIAMLGWKLAIDSIKRMREAEYDIDLGDAYFDFVCEFMVFLAQAADRIAYRELTAEQRSEFTTALAQRMAAAIEDNRDMLLVDVTPGKCQRHFLDLFNRRGAEYADHGYAESGPDFGFRRCFAACLQEVLPEKDRLWAVDQVMEIESPEAIKALEKTLAGLFHPDSGATRKRRIDVKTETDA
ncbi:MAG: hypothetical protein Q8O52_07985 [Sulfuritalea sp.]|nr:hypothetical protein [Sulfuritalea sp.]